MSKKQAPRANRLEFVSRREERDSSRNDYLPKAEYSSDAPLLYSLLEGLQIGVANVAASGTVLYANSRFIEMLKVHPNKNIIGTPLSRFVSPASWMPLNEALKLALTMRAQGEMKIESPSGHLRTMQLSLVPICVQNETTVMVTATEVTELVEKNKALRETEESLHSLSARILQLQDQERRRIARDLHDITGQELAVVIMSLNQLANNVNNPGVNARQILGESVTLVRKIEDEIRTLSYLLHPPLLDEFGLRSALSWYAEGFTKRSGIEVTVETPRNLPRLSAEKETALFRVVQESLTNVLRHSNSSKARIRLQLRSAGIQLSVEDEGHRISRDAHSKISQDGTVAGVGTQGMRERLQQFGGTLKLRVLSRGMQVVATMPVDATDAATAQHEHAAFSVPERLAPVDSLVAVKPIKRILVADDHDVTRQGIRSLLTGELDIEICGEAQDGLEAVSKARELNPDLVIMDISMPGASGFSAATTLRNSGSPAKIIFFTTHTYSEIERMSQVCGFEGFVTKTNATRDLLRAVRAVFAGNRFFDSEVIRGGG